VISESSMLFVGLLFFLAMLIPVVMAVF